MSDDRYQRLRECLDQYTVGYPAAPSGVEIAILKKLFTEEEAELFTKMGFQSEAPEEIAERVNRGARDISDLLESMSDKGLVFRRLREGRYVYRIAPFVVGIYEYQMQRMDRELAALLERYHEETWIEDLSRYPSGFHTIPLEESLDVAWNVAPYDLIRAFLKSQEKICVATCVCRMQKQLVGKDCGQPLDVCFYFGDHAEYVVDKHGGRWVTLDEALDIQKRCEDRALVTQVDCTENPVALCHCCDCCCGMLIALKRQSRPAESVVSNHYAGVDADLCSGCESCLDRCPVTALRMIDEGILSVDRERCIGCGVCVPVCPTGALALRQKPEGQRWEKPLKKTEYALQISELRRRLDGPGG